jgi:hypothetical protein
MTYMVTTSHQLGLPTRGRGIDVTIYVVVRLGSIYYTLYFMMPVGFRFPEINKNDHLVLPKL